VKELNFEELMEYAKKLTRKDEMQIFAQALKAYPTIEKYGEKVAGKFFNHHKSLVDLVMKAHGGKLYSHSLVTNAAILRSFEFLQRSIMGIR
jgi:hypothetical protein